MSLLRLNEDSISAYSVCFANGIAMVRAHIPGEDVGFHKWDPYVNPIWLYVPICKGERVSQIWKRQGFVARKQALLVSAN